MALFGGRKPAAGKPAAGGTGGGAAPAHKFWSTQPVPKLEDKSPVVVSGPIDAPKTVADVRAEPYQLPEGFRWITLDVQDEAQRGAFLRCMQRALCSPLPARQCRAACSAPSLRTLAAPTATPALAAAAAAAVTAAAAAAHLQASSSACCATTTWRMTTTCSALPTASASCCGR